MTTGDVAAAEPFWQRALEYFDSRVNPVLVKDLRLWMRGKLFIALYLMLVLILVIGAGLYTYAAREIDFNGQLLWSILFGVCLAVCGAIIPNMIYERFRSELKNRATELALLSELTAAHIVRGKLFSAWAASLLVLSAAAPVFATAYLLGGIDLPTAAYHIAWLIWAAAVMPTLQLMIATLGAHVGFRLFAILLLLGQAWGAIETAKGFNTEYIEGGGLNEPEIWGISAMILVGGLFSAHFFYQVAISRLRGDNENREFAPRLALLLVAVVQALQGVVLLFFMTPAIAVAWYFVPALFYAWVFGVGFFFITRTTDQLSTRLWQGWPRVGLIRLLFYPGHRRLCAFLLVGYFPVVLLLLAAWVDDNFRLNNDISRAGVHSMIPFIFLAVGLIAHDVFVIPFCRQRGWRPAAILSILGVNIVLLLIAATGGVLAHVNTSLRELKPVFLSLSPITAFFNISSLSASSYPKLAVLTIFLYVAALFIALCAIAFCAWLDGRGYYIGGIGKYSIGSDQSKSK